MSKQNQKQGTNFSEAENEFIQAIADHDTEKVANILKKTPNLVNKLFTKKSDDGLIKEVSAILLATINNDVKMIELLLELGADINLKHINEEMLLNNDKYGSVSPIDCALHCDDNDKRLPTIEYLLKKGAAINPHVTEAIFNFAISRSNQDEDKKQYEFLKKGNFETLELLIFNKKIEVVKLLLKYEALKFNISLNSTLFITSEGDIDSVKFLLENGADFTTPIDIGGDSYSAIGLAAILGFDNIVDIILNHYDNDHKKRDACIDQLLQDFSITKILTQHQEGERKISKKKKKKKNKNDNDNKEKLFDLHAALLCNHPHIYSKIKNEIEKFEGTDKGPFNAAFQKAITKKIATIIKEDYTASNYIDKKCKEDFLEAIYELTKNEAITQDALIEKARSLFVGEAEKKNVENIIQGLLREAGALGQKKDKNVTGKESTGKEQASSSGFEDGDFEDDDDYQKSLEKQQDEAETKAQQYVRQMKDFSQTTSAQLLMADLLGHDEESMAALTKGADKREILMNFIYFHLGNNASLDFLIKNDADLNNLNLDYENFDETDFYKNMTPLALAAYSNNIFAIQKLIDSGVDINKRYIIRFEDGQEIETTSAIYQAAFAGNIDCTELLAKNGAKISQNEIKETLLLSKALEAKNFKVVTSILKSFPESMIDAIKSLQGDKLVAFKDNVKNFLTRIEGKRLIQWIKEESNWQPKANQGLETIAEETEEQQVKTGLLQDILDNIEGAQDLIFTPPIKTQKEQEVDYLKKLLENSQQRPSTKPFNQGGATQASAAESLTPSFLRP